MTDGKYRVETGPGHDFDFDYTSKLQRVAIENAVLKIEDYVYVFRRSLVHAPAGE